MDRGAQVLVLHGSPGSGKTTLAEAIVERLRQENLASALIDLDALSIVHPYRGRTFTRANLRAVWPNYAAVPDVRVVLPLVVVDQADLRELKEITDSERFLVCELTAPRDVLERRVIEREPNAYWRSRVLEFVARYHARDDHPTIRDFQARTDTGSIEGTAIGVIHRCGWKPSETANPRPG
jgi:tRNA uridine 5-carbamoylmethylation protein Kti12